MKKKCLKLLTLALTITVLLSGCGSENVEVNKTIENTPIPETTVTPPIECAEETEPPQAVEEIVSGEYEYGNYYIEEGYLSIELYRQMADVTTDGVLDYIVTSFYILPEEWAKETSLEEKIAENIWLADSCVAIYDGTTVSGDELGEAIWKGYYAAPHCGNGQISLVHDADGEYLLASDLYIGMGEASYSYKVFSLSSDGEEQVKDEWFFSVRIEGDTEAPYEEQEECLKTFREKIAPWVEKGELIVATDVDMEEQLISMEDKRYTAADYYNKALDKYVPECE